MLIFNFRRNSFNEIQWSNKENYELYIIISSIYKKIFNYDDTISMVSLGM